MDEKECLRISLSSYTVGKVTCHHRQNYSKRHFYLLTFRTVLCMHVVHCSVLKQPRVRNWLWGSSDKLSKDRFTEQNLTCRVKDDCLELLGPDEGLTKDLTWNVEFCSIECWECVDLLILLLFLFEPTAWVSYSTLAKSKVRSSRKMNITSSFLISKLWQTILLFELTFRILM